MSEAEKRKILIEDFCEDEYELGEMEKWIDEKGIDEVFSIVKSLFYEDL